MRKGYIVDIGVENCKRCNGDGYRKVRLGLPGQDQRVIGATNIVWGEYSPIMECEVCKGKGKTKTKPIQPSRQIVNDTYTGIEIT